MVVTSSLCIALSRLDGAGSGAGPARRLAGGAQALRGILVNPMPWSILLGVLLSAMRWQLPGPLERTIAMLADAASPVALFTIGAVLARSALLARDTAPARRGRSHGHGSRQALPRRRGATCSRW
jgi:malonate transporter